MGIESQEERKALMAGLAGKSGPPGNMNAFKHGLAAIEKRREDGVTTEREETIKSQILQGLIADRGGDDQISTAMRILAEVIASDAALLVSFNQAIEGVIRNNAKARENPKALAQLDGYKRGLVNSLTSNIAKYGLERVAKIETLEQVLADSDETEETANGEGGTGNAVGPDVATEETK